MTKPCPSCAPERGWVYGDFKLICACCGCSFGAFYVTEHPYLNNTFEVHQSTYNTYGVNTRTDGKI